MACEIEDIIRQIVREEVELVVTQILEERTRLVVNPPPPEIGHVVTND